MEMEWRWIKDKFPTDPIFVSYVQSKRDTMNRLRREYERLEAWKRAESTRDADDAGAGEGSAEQTEDHTIKIGNEEESKAAGEHDEDAELQWEDFERGYPN